ncbi:cutinase transcription factor 1 [Fusarium beomiforme]|uniref:Cutinase transcription factor 1 n=1 Tax=Fusarium beomiforme TaxID=44412 RepID=A0A9P5E4L3_9HYPO|nr:cutinase transcription factor 1 [Fusarium beomiforme]
MIFSIAAPLRPRLQSLRRLRPNSTGQTASFSSTSLINRSQRTRQELSRNKAGEDQTSEQNPSYSAFSLNSLGLGKGTKFVLIVILSVFGTIETWFWCKAFWQWRKGRQEE